MPNKPDHPPELVARASRVRLLALDADGVMTDGGVYHDELGGTTVRFDIKDGMGLWRLKEHGCHIAIISGRECRAIRHRAETLQIPHVRQDVDNKPQAIRDLATELGLDLEEIAFMGDDVNDLWAMRQVGLAAAPADAEPEVAAAAHFVAQRPGGRGAVRELCELIISAQSAAERPST
jgi:3-deoxy-D-manno-octulosonate 8-phosphate phosphatase (KDO 8-P phosphatase)